MTGPTLGEDRASFMARVRTAVGRDASSTVTPPTLAEINAAARLVHPAPAAELAELFIARAAAVGMRSSRTTAAGLAEHLTTLLQDLKAASATMSISPGPLADAANHALSAAACRRIDPAPHDRTLEHHYAADAGITDVLAAVAETGSIVLRSGPHHSRGTFIVPPVHIALVRPDQILPDVIDLCRAFDPAPAEMVIVTGPSKTADIEGILVTGIHGPREVHLVLVEQ